MSLLELLKLEMSKGRFWTHSITLVGGCSKTSPGCANCWSEAMARRFHGMVDESGDFDGTLRLHHERLKDIQPKSNRRKQRVWTYWNDMFHEKVDEDFQLSLMEDILVSPDYHIICTKRPHIAYEFLRDWPLAPIQNLIILVTMEDQTRLDARLPHALKLSVAGWNVGLLIEPMLEELKLPLFGTIPFDISLRYSLVYEHIDWLIVGPENGRDKRPFDVEWAMRLQRQAKEAGVPFFYKGGLLGGKVYHEAPDM